MRSETASTNSTPVASFTRGAIGVGILSMRRLGLASPKTKEGSSRLAGVVEASSAEIAEITNLKEVVTSQVKQLEQLATENEQLATEAAALRLQLRELGHAPVEVSKDLTGELRRRANKPAHEQLVGTIMSAFGFETSFSTKKKTTGSPRSLRTSPAARRASHTALAISMAGNTSSNDAFAEIQKVGLDIDPPRANVRMRRPSWIESLPDAESIQPEVLQTFQRFGASTGHMSVDNLAEALRSLNLHVSDEQAKVILEKFDEDQNGTLEREEFAKLSSHLSRFTSFSESNLQTSSETTVHEVVRRASLRPDAGEELLDVQKLDSFIKRGKTGLSPRRGSGSTTPSFKRTPGSGPSTTALLNFLSSVGIKQFQQEAIDSLEAHVAESEVAEVLPRTRSADALVA